MKKSLLASIYESKYKDEKLSSILDSLLFESSESSYLNKYGGLIGKYNPGRISAVQEKIQEVNKDVLYTKLVALREIHIFYSNLYEAVKADGLSVERTLELYQDSGISLHHLYEKVITVYHALDEEEKINFKLALDNYCFYYSGRFQPFISETIDWADEKNIKNLQRAIDHIQKNVRRYLEANGVGLIFHDLVESQHLLLNIRKVLAKENLEDVAKKYQEYIMEILINKDSKSKEIYKEKYQEYLEYIRKEVEVVTAFIEMTFKNYKSIKNPQDISFEQMIELMYYSCKENLLKEVSQSNLDVLDFTYEYVKKLEKDYEEKYKTNFYEDLSKIDLENEDEYKTYLSRVKELGFSKALYDYLLKEYASDSIDMYKLNLIKNKNNKIIDLDLYNELVFAKNLKYLIESDNSDVVRWISKGKLFWKKGMIIQLKENMDKLYSDESEINSQSFALNQSDFIVPDELILKFPSQYTNENMQVNIKDNTLRMGILLKNTKKATIPKEVAEEGNYYLLHIDINDIKQSKSKFEIQLNLCVGSDIKNRIQIMRMDNYVNKGIHKNTGSIKLDTTTHLQKYNALNKVRKNKNGEMDIYKNWKDGVKDFNDGLDIFLSEFVVNEKMKEKIKSEIINKINNYRNNRI